MPPIQAGPATAPAGAPVPRTCSRRKPAGTWTDLAGIAHIREVATMLTFCAVAVDNTVSVRATSGCDLCVAESIRDFARCPGCAAGCCAREQGKTGAGLDRRVPQASEAARIDRRLSWSGPIFPPPAPCQDLGLMERVHDRLHDL